ARESIQIEATDANLSHAALGLGLSTTRPLWHPFYGQEWAWLSGFQFSGPQDLSEGQGDEPLRCPFQRRWSRLAMASYSNLWTSRYQPSRHLLSSPPSSSTAPRSRDEAGGSSLRLYVAPHRRNTPPLGA